MLENERKFLVREIPLLDNVKSSLIEQGYISFNPEVRIRKKDNKYYLTKKSDGKQIRDEKETIINKKTFDILKPLIKGKIIKKVRYEIELKDGKIAELDIYSDGFNGLNVVEMEFNSLIEAKKFDVPSWFSKEVTYDDNYKNKNLAQVEDINEFLKEYLR